MAGNCRGGSGRPRRGLSPPAERPEPLRPSPAHTRALRRNSYELRAHDGTFIAIVARSKAEAGITEGKLELQFGQHGAFLRPILQTNGGERNPRPSKSRTWSGPLMLELGRVSQYRHNYAACDPWPTSDASRESNDERIAARKKH